MGVHAQCRDLVGLAPHPALLAAGELARLAAPSSSAFFLDVDGTLLEIQPRPEDVAADARLREILGDIAAVAGDALALVSGRKIDDLDRIFRPVILPAAGLHGAEIRFFDRARTFAPNGAMEPARPRLRAFAERHPGLLLEDKGATLALHFRQRPELADDVLAMLQSVAQAPGLAVQQGKMVVELKEASHSKATAIAALLASSPFAGRRPVFIGDDLTDESGFDFVNGRGGVSIRVASTDGPTAAQFLIADPAQLRQELAKLAL